jgi:hypothetical protein
LAILEASVLALVLVLVLEMFVVSVLFVFL